MCIYVYTHIYIYTYACIHTYIYICIYMQFTILYYTILHYTIYYTVVPPKGRREGDDGHDRAPLEGGGGPQGSPGVGAEYVYIYI